MLRSPVPGPFPPRAFVRAAPGSSAAGDRGSPAPGALVWDAAALQREPTRARGHRGRSRLRVPSGGGGSGGGGLETKLLSIYDSCFVTMGTGGPRFLRAHPHPSPFHPSDPLEFPGPGFCGRTGCGFLWEGEAEAEQRGVLGSGVQVRCSGAVAHGEGRRTRWVALRVQLRSTPLFRHSGGGCPGSRFLPGMGLIHSPREAWGRGRGSNGNQIGNGSPGGCWAGVERWWGGGDESALELITNTTFCLKACGVYLRCFVHAKA